MQQQDKAFRKVSQGDYQENYSSKSDSPLKDQRPSQRILVPGAPPPLAQKKQTSQQNDKIVMNNKMIQDLLSESKKSNLTNSSLSNNDSTLKLTQHIQNKIQGGGSFKIQVEQKDHTGIHSGTLQDESRIQVPSQNEGQLALLMKGIEGEQNKNSNYLSAQTQSINSLTSSPLEQKRVPATKLNLQNLSKRSSVNANQRSSKSGLNPLQFIQISAKFKEDIKMNTGNHTTTNANMTQSAIAPTEDAYRIKPKQNAVPGEVTMYSQRTNAADTASMKSLREIKSSEKSRPNFRIHDPINIAIRNSSSQQGNLTSTSLIKSSQSQQSNYLLTPQQHFLSNQLPSPTNLFKSTSQFNSSANPSSSAVLDSTTSLQNKAYKEKESKHQYTLKLPFSNDYGNLPSTQSIKVAMSNPPSSNSNRQSVLKTMNAIDLSSLPTGVGSLTDQITSFRSFAQNQGGQNTGTSINMHTGLHQTKSKKFAQSFTQLTKIVNQQSSPDRSPKDYLMNNDDIVGDQIIESKTDPLSNKFKVLSIYGQYEVSLKKDVPSALSDGPTTRQEIVQMQKWFQNSLNQIQKINSSKKVDHLSSLVELACKELLRQVSIECSERGELLQSAIRYQMLTYKEQLEQQKIYFEKFKKSSKDEFLESHKTYEGIFQSKDVEITKLKKELTELQQKLSSSVNQMEQNMKDNKSLRDQLTKLKELATYMKQRQSLSEVENNKLRSKIKKGYASKQKLTDRKISVQDDRFRHDNNEAIRIETEQLPTSQSHNTSIDSDLFKIDENQKSERIINIGGVNESIDKLNYVRFTNPDDVKKCEVTETQTGASLLILSDMREAEVQTELMNLLDEDYDPILQDKLTFDQFMYKVENQEAQVDYLKEREINLIEQIESLKAERNQAPERYGSHHSQSQIFQVTSPIALGLNLSPSRASGLDFDIPSLTSLNIHKSKKPDEVDSVLTEKYKNIMQKLNLDSKNVSESVSSDSSEEDDFDDSPIPISKDERAAKRAKRMNLIKAVQKKTGNNRQLGEKINQVESLFNDVGKQIVDKVKKNKYYKFRNFMPLPTLLKQINLVYLERMRMINENARIKEQECSNFTYFFLTKLYGFKKIVDQKFIIFMLSIKKYLTVLRVNIFARFIGLLENRTHNFSLDECNKYIEVLNYVYNISTAGQQPNPVENDQRYMVPFIRAMAFVGSFADSRMTFDEQNEFKKDIESLKEVDQKGVHTAGLIDFDVFLNKMLAKYRQLVNRAKKYVINAFAASDLDGNGVCNLDEFLILNRHIEVDLYDEDVLTQIFHENADKIIEGEMNLTFDKFAVVCVDYNLFTDEAQDKFLGIRHKREIDFKMQEFQTEWVFRKRELKAIFEQLNLISSSSKEKWLQIIEVLDDKLQTSNQDEFKPLLIAYKILQNESRSLLSMEEEVKRDEELLNQYQERAMKDQKEQQHSYQVLDQSSRLSENGSPFRHNKNKKSNSGLQQMLQIPIGNSFISLSGQKRVSQYASQSQVSSSSFQPAPSNASTTQIFNFNPQLVAQQSSTSQISVINPTTQSSNSNNMEQNLKEANFIELMLQKLKNVSNKEKFLVNILLKNGVDEPTENDITQIQNIILALDPNYNNSDSQQNAKQLLFSFLMKQINNAKKTSASQTLIS